MKRVLVFTFIIAMLLSIAPFADEGTAFVTISNGSPVLVNEPVALSDLDGDGKTTVNDALIAAHDDGMYGYSNTAYGLGITKLWGIENGNGYGYYVNNAPCMSLSDEIKNGDSVYAYIYTDTEAFSDTFCYFDKSEISAVTGEKITLTLTKAGYDSDWNFTTSPLSDAFITVDGEKTQYKTDANGQVTLEINKEGTFTLSAVCDGMVLVPPVCVAKVTSVPQTADIFPVFVIAALASVVILKKKYA